MEIDRSVVLFGGRIGGIVELGGVLVNGLTVATGEQTGQLVGDAGQFPPVEEGGDVAEQQEVDRRQGTVQQFQVDQC